MSAKKPSRHTAPKPQPPRQIPLDLSRERPLSFETLQISSGNQQLLRQIRDFTAWPSPVCLLIGPRGAGKTHIGTAWAQENPEALFIDDAKGAGEQTLFAQINRALTGRIQALLLTSSEHPALWDIKMPDLRSRLNNTPTFELPEADDDLLETIVRGLFAGHGRHVSQDLVTYMISRSERTVPALQAHVARLEAQAQTDKADITKAYAARHMTKP